MSLPTDDELRALLAARDAAKRALTEHKTLCGVCPPPPMAGTKCNAGGSLSITLIDAKMAIGHHAPALATAYLDMRAALREAETALEPFAAVARVLPGTNKDNDVCWSWHGARVIVADCKVAEAALATIRRTMQEEER